MIGDSETVKVRLHKIAVWLAGTAVIAWTAVCGCSVSRSSTHKSIETEFPWIGNGYPEGDFAVPPQMVSQLRAHAEPQRTKLVSHVKEIVDEDTPCLVVETLIFGGRGGEVCYEGLGIVQDTGDADRDDVVTSIAPPWWHLLQAQLESKSRRCILPEPMPIELTCIVTMSYWCGGHWQHSAAINPWGVLSSVRVTQDAQHEAAAMRFTNVLLIIAQDARLRKRMPQTIEEFLKFMSAHVVTARWSVEQVDEHDN